MTRLSIVIAFVLAGLTAGSSAQQPAPQAPPASPPQPAAQTPTPAAPATPPVPQAPAQTPPSTAGNRQQPSFRAGIDIVSLNVTVTDASNHYVTDLADNEFSVFEDGVKQNLTFFSRRQQPIALSLLLDSSASMEQHIGTLQTAATNFIKKLKPTDIAQVIDFDSRVEIRQGFTGNQADLQTAIEQTNAGGSTSLHNAIYIALKELRKVKAVSEEDVRRQALIVFSDGEDTSSLVSFEEVLDLAKRSETAIYAIALRGNDVQAKGFREAEFVMRTLAQETGGRAFFPARIEDLAGVYAQIADELASQYTLGYTSANQRRDGAWRRLVVQVARANITPRTKKGYYAPTVR
ncbi:MAG TPA: VWA domain-containing protein [Vicinamibacterales bacterium]|nr:VWA domain-containing protein [Vicinamibacterales bacterium]